MALEVGGGDPERVARDDEHAKTPLGSAVGDLGTAWSSMRAQPSDTVDATSTA
jgi:hypothetical protein